MTCDQCPDVLPCWQGLLERFPCHYCGRIEIHTHDADRNDIRVLVRSCPPDAPAPAGSYRYNRRICNQCRVTRGFSVKRSCPGVRSYTYEE